MTVLLLVLQIALGIALPAWIVRRDMRRLPPARLARAWNEASFWSAVVGFQLLCIPVHFVRTRRSVLGGVIGLLWALVVFVVIALFSVAVDYLASAVGG